MKKFFSIFILGLLFLVGCNGNNDDITPEEGDIYQTAINSTFINCEIKTTDLNVFRYYLYTPQNPKDNMPLIVYLHGGSGKGDDLNLITNVDGFPKFLRDGQLGEIAAYVIIPQVPSTKNGWPEVRTSLDYLIDSTITTYNLNKNMVSLTGHSMGGTGTWNVALKEPTRFYKIAPLSGSIETTNTTINALKNLLIWTMVGSADTIVAPNSAIAFMEEMKKINSNDKITVFEGATHFDVPALAYLNKDLGLINWLIS